MNKISFVTAPILIAFICLFSCSDDLKVNSLTVHPHNVTLSDTDSIRINASAVYVGGEFNSYHSLKFNWSSSNPDVATVDTLGMVRPQSIGKTAIIAELDGVRDSCIVTVEQSHESE